MKVGLGNYVILNISPMCILVRGKINILSHLKYMLLNESVIYSPEEETARNSSTLMCFCYS